MGYAALTAFMDSPHRPTVLDLARQLVHFDFKRVGLCPVDPIAQDRMADMIARLMEQEIERALAKGQCEVPE